MNTYLITYDLQNSGIYSRNLLEERIKLFQAWARPTNSTWLIKTYQSRQDVFNQLSTTIGFLDKILIIQVTSNWIAKNLSNEVVVWMQGIMP